MQSVLGKLNFFTRAIRLGRAFVRCLYDATKGVVKPHHYIRVTQSMCEDIFMWCRFLEALTVGFIFSKRDGIQIKPLICSQIAQGKLNSVVGHILMGIGVSLVGPNIGNT